MSNNRRLANKEAEMDTPNIKQDTSCRLHRMLPTHCHLIFQ